MKENITIHGYKNTILFILFRAKVSVVVRRRWMETATLINNFFSWPYHAVLSSRPHSALHLLLGRGVLKWWPAVCRWCSLRQTKSLLVASWYPKAETATPRISRSHLHISLHNTHTFPFNHVTVSTYFHMCVLCKYSPIDGSVKTQYATHTNIIFCKHLFRYGYRCRKWSWRFALKILDVAVYILYYE